MIHSGFDSVFASVGGSVPGGGAHCLCQELPVVGVLLPVSGRRREVPVDCQTAARILLTTSVCCRNAGRYGFGGHRSSDACPGLLQPGFQKGRLFSESFSRSRRSDRCGVLILTGAKVFHRNTLCKFLPKKIFLHALFTLCAFRGLFSSAFPTFPLRSIPAWRFQPPGTKKRRFETGACDIYKYTKKFFHRNVFCRENFPEFQPVSATRGGTPGICRRSGGFVRPRFPYLPGVCGRRLPGP